MFRLSIVTPEKIFFEADVKSLVVPGTEGYLGVLSNHAPLITALNPGKIEFRDAEDQVRLLAVSGGFLEVSGNVATLLADAAEETDSIDIDRARAARKKAWQDLKDARSGEELVEARAALDRATNRIKLYEETH
ncbi:MAG: ATP synthase F1 subunit epsilon [candidate division Zixibacteria bacterium]|nr:ATP synthase F1 subunit epsilon [candidate division Zixibacteria bacterium]